MEEGNQLGRNLKVKWEMYINSSATPSEAAQQEKHDRLEDFLHSFLSMSANIAIDKEDLVNFSNDIHSVFNILVRKFMSDVQDLAPSHPNGTEYKEQDCDPIFHKGISPLMKYLINGRGWLVLNAMNTLAGQALSYSNDFVLLLVTLMQEAFRLPLPSNSDKDRKVSIPTLESCLHMKSTLKHYETVPGIFKRSTSMETRLSSSSALGGFAQHSRSTRSRTTRSRGKKNNDTTDSNNENNVRRNRPSGMIKSQSSVQFVYTRSNSHKKWHDNMPVVKWQLCIDSDQQTVDLNKTDAFDLCLVLLSLLERLCSSEVMHSTHRNSLSLFLAPQLAQVLTVLNKFNMESLQDERTEQNLFGKGWTSDNVALLQRLVIRVVLKLCFYSCTQHHEASKMASTGILFTLLQIAKDMHQRINSFKPPRSTYDKNEGRSRQGDAFQKEETDDSYDDACVTESKEAPSVILEANDRRSGKCFTPDQKQSLQLDPQCICEIIHGMILLLTSIMRSCSDNQTVVTHALSLLNEFTTSGGYTLMSSMLLDLDYQLSSGISDGCKIKMLKDRIFYLLSSLSKLITATKKAKLEYVHKFQCLKRTHNTCDYTHRMHHHHSLLGIAHNVYIDEKYTIPTSGSSTPTSPAEGVIRANRGKCCIAEPIDLMLDLIQEVQCRFTVVMLLYSVEPAGMCCCMTPNHVITPLLQNIEQKSAAVRSLLLNVLAKFVLQQLGGGEKQDSTSAGVCEECSARAGLSRPVSPQGVPSSPPAVPVEHYPSSDSAIGSDGSLQDGDEQSTRWQVLCRYTSLLASKDESLSVQIAKHLLHLVKHGNNTIKQELYLRVFLPCFESTGPSVDSQTGGGVTKPNSRITSPLVLEYCFCALPPMLTTASAQNLFLIQGGLSQLLHLLSLDVTRMHVLRVFEVLILSEESKISFDCKLRERTSTTDSGLSGSTQSLAKSNDSLGENAVVDAFVEIVLNVIPCDLDSSTEKYLSHSTSETDLKQDSSGQDECSMSYDLISTPVSLGGSYIETGSKALSESGNSSTLSPLSATPTQYTGVYHPEELGSDLLGVLSIDKLEMAADIWRTCSVLFCHSSTFQDCFLQHNGDILARRLLIDALQGLNDLSKNCPNLEVTWSPLNNRHLRRKMSVVTASVTELEFMLDIVGSLMRVNLTLAGLGRNTDGDSMEFPFRRVLSDIRKPLGQSHVLSSCLGRPIAEMIMSVSQSQHMNIHSNQCCQIANTSFLDDAALVWSLEEVQEVSDAQSEQSDLLSAEGGYEADSERDDSAFKAGLQDNKVEHHTNSSQNVLLYPQICCLLIELLAESPGLTYHEVLCYSVNHLISLAKSAKVNRAGLYQSGLPEILLRSYSEVLGSKDEMTQVERGLLLELFAVLIQHSLSAKELREYLTYFQAPEPPVGNLLTTLLDVVGNMSSQPSCFITFPSVTSSHSIQQHTIPQVDSDTSISSKNALSPDVDLTSPWVIAPMQLTCKTSITWPPLGKGFSLTMWLMVEEKSTSDFMAVNGEPRKFRVKNKTSGRVIPGNQSMDNIGDKLNQSASRTSIDKVSHTTKGYMHLLSLGNKELMFQMWGEPRSNKLLIRLCQGSGKDTTVQLAEATCSGMLTCGQWQHITVTYEEKIDGRRIAGLVTVVINGCLYRDIFLDYQHKGSVPYKPSAMTKLSCFVGHSQIDSAVTGSWQLGNMLIFNDCRVLNKEVAFHLYTKGPNYHTLSLCEGSKQSALYSRYISRDVLLVDVSHELLTGNREVDLKPLRECLSLAYSPSNRDVFSVHESTPVPSGTLSRVLAVSTTKYPPDALLQSPHAIEAHLLHSITPQIHKGVENAINETGGIKVFLYLFAKVVERESNRQLQAKALKLLFQLQTRSHALAMEFRDIGGSLMIAKVMATDRCIVGFEVLQILLDACCSESIIYRCASTGDYRVSLNSHAIIKDTKLVSQLLLAWRVWEKAEKGVWHLLFLAIEAIIRPDHQYQTFNITQLHSVNIVASLLMMSRERHHEDLAALPSESWQSLVHIIKGMMGTPPDPIHLAEVCDFLLSVHPAVKTFVCHAPSSFYFTEHSGAQQVYKQSLLRTLSVSSDVSSQGASSTSPQSTHCFLPREQSIPETDETDVSFPQQDAALSRTQDGDTSSSRGPYLRARVLVKQQSFDDDNNSTNDSESEGRYLETVDGGEADVSAANEETSEKTESSLTEADTKLSSGSTSPDVGYYQRPISLINEAEVPALNSPSDSSQTQSSSFDSLDASSKDNSLSLLCSGLLKLLTEALIVLPDSHLGKVIRIVLKPETLIVLAHHESSDIRANVVKLLDIYFHRANEASADYFLKMKGFHLLANQLHQYPASKDLIEACVTITFGKPIDLASIVELTTIQELSRFRQLSIILLMSLLENSIHDSPLCHNAICLANQLFEGSSSVATVMLENGLIETLCNVLSALCSHLPRRSMMQPGWDMLINDVQHFMACVANKVYSQNGNQTFQYLEDMLALLGGLEEGLRKKQGRSFDAAEIVFETQCYIVREVLDHFRATSMALESAVTAGKKGPSHQRTISYSERKYEEYQWKQRVTPRHWSDNKRSVKVKGSVSSRSSESNESQLSPGLGVTSWRSSQDSVRAPPLTTQTSLPLPSKENYSSAGSSQWDQRRFTISDATTFSKQLAQKRDSVFESKPLPFSIERRYSASLDTLLRLQRAKGANKPTGKDNGPVSEQEMAKRFQRLCLTAVNTVVHRDLQQLTVSPRGPRSPTYQLSRHESALDPIPTILIKELFHLLTDSLTSTMERKLGRRKQWESILWSSRETLRLQLERLLIHMMSPNQDMALRIFTLQVAHLPKAKQILKSVFHSSLEQHMGKFDLYLYDFLHNHSLHVSDVDRNFGMKLRNVLKDAGFQAISATVPGKHSRQNYDQELEIAGQEDNADIGRWRTLQREQAISAWRKLHTLAREVANSAMSVTQTVAAQQNRQRTRLLDHLKITISNSLDVRTAWQDLIQNLTHERAIWFDKDCCPSSWQLDPTEGPARVRRRLQRCHLGIPEKFLAPERRKTYKQFPSIPLDYLFEDIEQSSSSSDLKRKLQMNEKISGAFSCTHVTPSAETLGDLLLGVASMYFVGEEPIQDPSSNQTIMGERDVMTISWMYEDIKEIHMRWYQLRDNALEIFLTNGQTLLLGFEDGKERDSLYQQVKSQDLPNLLEVDNISAVTEAWCHGQMTNFEYITHLNKLGGRSFNDLMQYPVFPFVLSDYSSNEIDLNNGAIYRDLSKPVAVQSKEMENKYKETYKVLKEDYDKMGDGYQQVMWMQPFHYGSHYSNSGTVLQYLVRLPPFTSMFLQYQDNHFDLPDRTFHCLNTSWRLSSFQSSTDVKELIPEFFFLPEFLINNERYEFGKRQNGTIVNNVMLPPWAKNNARLFILIHRQALESLHVSQLLHTWIDLVFGCKQKGQAAVEAINVFHPATYFGIDTSTIEDSVRRRAVETMIKTYGQTPKQLFQPPHPYRMDTESSPLQDAGGSLVAQLIQRGAGVRTVMNQDTDRVWGPVPQVKGMRWGNYVGSPSTGEPVIRWQQCYSIPPTQLMPLPTGAVCGVAGNRCLLVMYSKEKGVSSMNAVDIKWSGIVSWGHPDGILRLKHKLKGPSINFIHTNTNDQITCCNSVSDCKLLFTGTYSGIITAYRTKYNPDKQSSIEVVGSPVHLYGHTARINCLYVCRPYSIMVSASDDGTCIIWDLNRLSYVRSLLDEVVHCRGITTVTVSDVAGDIATASNMVDGGSELSLWTINGSLVRRVQCDSTIHCLAFSNLSEGIAVNSVAAGCQDGVVRFWSVIDLTPVRALPAHIQRAIVSLTFTHDSQFLVTCDTDGLVIIWGKKDGSNRKVPKFEAFIGTMQDAK